MLDKLRAIVRAGNKLCGLISGLGILLMGLILAYEVVMRGVFKSPTIWVMNTAIYLFIWTMLLGAAYTLMLGKHVRIDLIIDMLPKGLQNVLEVITSAMGIVFCYVVSKQGWAMVSTSIRLNKMTDNLMRIPMWWVQIPLVIGFVLLALQFLVNFLDHLAVLFGGSGEKK